MAVLDGGCVYTAVYTGLSALVDFASFLLDILFIQGWAKAALNEVSL